MKKMYKTYQKPVVTASVDVKVPPPKISKFFIFIVSILSKVYLYILFGFAKILLRGDDILFDFFRRTLSKESRGIVAFRHPDGREPQLLSWFFLYRLRALAAKKRIRFATRPHAIFVYGYEVVRWGGWVARLFMPNLGAIPIHHTKLDSKGMARIYNSAVDGPYPLALAPEGQVSYSTDTVPRLEHGVIRIGFHAAELLAVKQQAVNENCAFEILPLSVHFRYDNYGKSAMFKLLSKTEKLCNIINNNISFNERLELVRERILEINEERYNIKKEDNVPFKDRLEKVIETALETAEQILGIKKEGDFFARLYKVRHDCWDRIFIPGYDNLKKVSMLKRSVMDIKAGEGWYASRHQELADFGWYFKCLIPKDNDPLHLKVEYVQNLFDFASRTMGGAFSQRINIQPAKVIIKAAPPINLSERLSLYKTDRKTAVLDAVSDLEKAYLNCILETGAETQGENY